METAYWIGVFAMEAGAITHVVRRGKKRPGLVAGLSPTDWIIFFVLVPVVSHVIYAVKLGVLRQQ